MRGDRGGKGNPRSAPRKGRGPGQSSTWAQSGQQRRPQGPARSARREAGQQSDGLPPLVSRRVGFRNRVQGVEGSLVTSETVANPPREITSGSQFRLV